MNNQIATKTKKALVSIIITMILLNLLIAICLFRLFKTDLEIMIKVLLIGLTVMGLFFLIKEIINLVNYLKAPLVLIKQQENRLIINDSDEILIEDLLSIEKGANNSKLLFYQADLIITTTSKQYIITNIDDVDQVYERLNQMIIKKEVV